MIDEKEDRNVEQRVGRLERDLSSLASIVDSLAKSTKEAFASLTETIKDSERRDDSKTTELFKQIDSLKQDISKSKQPNFSLWLQFLVVLMTFIGIGSSVILLSQKASIGPMTLSIDRLREDNMDLKQNLRNHELITGHAETVLNAAINKERIQQLEKEYESLIKLNLDINNKVLKITEDTFTKSEYYREKEEIKERLRILEGNIIYSGVVK